MTAEGDDEAVGYGRPPRHSRFQKGRSGNPRGRPRKRAATESSDLAAILEAPVTVTQGGRAVPMNQKEIELRQMLKQALAGQLRAITYLFEEFQRYGAMPTPQATGGLVLLPSNAMPEEMAMWLLEHAGLPPWSARDIGRTRALYLKYRSEDQRRWDNHLKYPALEDPTWQMIQPAARPPRATGPRTVKAIVQDIARERRSTVIAGKPCDLTTVELMLHTLNRKRLLGDIGAAKLMSKISSRYIDTGEKTGGYLVLPETATEEMFLKLIELHNQDHPEPRSHTTGKA